MKERMMVLIVLVAAAGMIMGFSGPVAAIQGECDNCHVMHNSQNGEPVVQVYSGGQITVSDTPIPQLLNADCVACHAGDTDTPTNSFEAPIVLHINDPVGQGRQNTLAGGDFYWVADGLGNPGGANDASGHNVVGISNEDTVIQPDGRTPPGFDDSATPGANGDGVMNDGPGPWSVQLTCAGRNGCHGNHTDDDPFAAIKGAHHGNTDLTATRATAATATTIGGSYRFLSGIWGLENSEWNWNETQDLHNEYRGEATNANYNYKYTISYSCAQCHGFFHSDIGDASPWLRHPTDVVLPASGEYNDYNPDGGNLYSLEAPVARTNVLAASSNVVTPGQDIIMCLSCHRAHGSPEPDILRWTYANNLAGTGTDDTGCFTCHTTKNED
jgi:predicted CXXCH cytochrome family protein